MERAAETLANAMAFVDGAVHAIGKEADTAGPFAFSGVHGGVGGLQQLEPGGTVLRVDADTGTYGKTEPFASHIDRFGEEEGDLADGGQKFLPVVGFLQQKNELVATDAGGEPAFAHRLAEAAADHLEDRIADSVAERVVKGLEAIDIDENDREAFGGDGTASDSRIEPLVHQQPVGEAGEGIVMRQEMKIGFGLSQDGNIGEGNHEMSDALRGMDGV